MPAVYNARIVFLCLREGASANFLLLYLDSWQSVFGFVFNEESRGMDLWDLVTNRQTWQQKSWREALQGRLGELQSLDTEELGPFSLKAEVKNSLSSWEGKPNFSNQLFTRQPRE